MKARESAAYTACKAPTGSCGTGPRSERARRILGWPTPRSSGDGFPQRLGDAWVRGCRNSRCTSKSISSMIWTARQFHAVVLSNFRFQEPRRGYAVDGAFRGIVALRGHQTAKTRWDWHRAQPRQLTSSASCNWQRGGLIWPTGFGDDDRPRVNCWNTRCSVPSSVAVSNGNRESAIMRLSQ